MQVVVAEAKKKTAGDAAEAAEKKAGERRLRIVAVEPESGLQGQLVLLRRAPLDAADEAVAAISDDAAAFDALLTTLLDAEIHHLSNVLRLGDDLCLDERLFDMRQVIGLR